MSFVWEKYVKVGNDMDCRDKTLDGNINKLEVEKDINDGDNINDNKKAVEEVSGKNVATNKKVCPIENYPIAINKLLDITEGLDNDEIDLLIDISNLISKAEMLKKRKQEKR